MTTKSKILTGISVAVLVLILMYIIKLQHDAIERQKQIEQTIIKFQQLEGGIARIESRMTSDKSELESKLQDLGINVKVIQDDLDAYGAKLESVSVVVDRTEGFIRSEVPSDWQETSEEPKAPEQKDETCVSKFGYCAHTQGLNLYERGLDGSKIPFGGVKFNAAVQNPWDIFVYPRKYYSVMTMGKDKSGKIIAHSQMMIEDKDGKKYKIGVDESSFIETVAETSRMYWWNPRIAAGYSLGIDSNIEFTSSVGAQFFASAYASNRSRPKWMFIGLGGAYDIPSRNPILTFSPFMYNVFPYSQLVQNVYVGPTVALSIAGAVSGNATVSILF